MTWKKVINRKHRKVINLNFAKEILVLPIMRKPDMPKDAKPFAVVAVMHTDAGAKPEGVNQLFTGSEKACDAYYNDLLEQIEPESVV